MFRRLIIFLLALPFLANGANYNMANGTQTITCGTTHNFYDSGGSGGNYGTNQSYTMTFVAGTAGQCLVVNFTGFNTESGYDILAVYDGTNNSAPFIGSYDGSTIPSAITCTSGALTFHFVSDGSVQYSGWAATIQCTNCPAPPPPSLIMSNAPATLTCPNTMLFYDSGGGSSDYSSSENLTKTITGPAGGCLQFIFTSFNTESGYDRLRIFDGPNGASPLIGNYSGTTGPGTITASGTSLTFSFTSDGSVEYAGWTASVICVSACTGTPAGGTATTASTCPVSGSVALSVTGSTSGCGITYQWQSATSSSGPWSNISGATTSTFNGAVNGLTYYRRLTQCGANTGTSTAVQAGNVPPASCSLSNYAVSAITYSFETFTGTSLPTTDDVLYNNILMFGFPFCYTGGQYWGGYAASNTSFVFDAVPCFPNIQSSTYAAPGVGTGYTLPQPAPTPATSIPRNAILGPWHDTNPSLGGSITYTTMGTSPNRRFILSYSGIPMYSCGTASPSIYFTGQIKLFETTNTIEIHIGNKGVCPGWENGQAVLGLHNYDGTAYLGPVNATAHNVDNTSPYATWTMNNTAYRFTTTCGSSCKVLPLEFKDFFGERINYVNHLYWETAMEEDLHSFKVERSVDASHFEEIATVTPKNRASKYEYEDYTAKPGIVNYYRISAVEKNGSRSHTFTYPLGAIEGQIAVTGIYPNPNRGDFNVGVDSKISTVATVNVIDQFGNIVKSFTKNISAGASELKIDASDLSSGIYLLEIINYNKELMSKQKLVKVD